MKKQLLLLGAASVALTSMAVVENNQYESMHGLVVKNLYNISRNYAQDDFLAEPYAEFNNKTRSMVEKDGILYIPHSRVIIEGETSNELAHVIMINQATGKTLGQVQLTVGGEPIAGLLCANQLGIDDFGNFWLMGLVGDSEKTPFKLYHIKDINTGDSELVATIKLPDDEVEAKGRHDYYDLVGDVTGKEAGTVLMTPVANGDGCWVLGWERPQGTDEWNPHMDDQGYVGLNIQDTYPADQLTWNGAPMVRIIRDEDHSGNLFYIDAFVTNPSLYDTSGTLLESFASCPDIAPKANCNGCMEFSVGGNDFFAYTKGDYDAGPGSQIQVSKMGEGQSFEGMTEAWEFPQGTGLGNTTDTGSRMFGICPRVTTDANGKQGCTLSIYKCNGGLATYTLNEPGFVDAAVNDIIADDIQDANAPVEYYNMQGMRLANPRAGQIVIRRQGNTATKMQVL